MDALLCFLCGDRGCPECDASSYTDKDKIDIFRNALQEVVSLMSEVREGDVKEQAIRGIVAWEIARRALLKGGEIV